MTPGKSKAERRYATQTRLVAKMLEGKIHGVKKLSNGALCLQTQGVKTLWTLEEALKATGWKRHYHFRKCSYWTPERRKNAT